MRVLIYNIAYATGAPRKYYDVFLRAHRNLKPTNRHFELLQTFIADSKPDIIGLVEVDIGSYRTAFKCQALKLAEHLNYEAHRSVKYKHLFFKKHLPLFRDQGNAVLTQKGFNGQFHFLSRGVKRLVIEVDFENFRFFLVHLALSQRIRAKQLDNLMHLIKKDSRPVIIGGDFNTFKGAQELKRLAAMLNLKNANTKAVPTFPSWKPKHQIDYILHSPEIELKGFFVPNIHLSDHLPIIADFDL
jgi:endonuclease/exonuclease/phosphatase family metal-dependent hydrolase